MSAPGVLVAGGQVEPVHFDVALPEVFAFGVLLQELEPLAVPGLPGAIGVFVGDAILLEDRGEHDPGDAFALAAEAPEVALDDLLAGLDLVEGVGGFAGFRIVDDEQVGALVSMADAADGGIEAAGHEHRPAGRAAGDLGEDDLVSRPGHHHPLTPHRHGAGPLGRPLQGPDRGADRGKILEEEVVDFVLDLEVVEDHFGVGSGRPDDERESDESVVDEVAADAFGDRGLAIAAGGGGRLVAAGAGGVDDVVDQGFSVAGEGAAEFLGVVGLEKVEDVAFGPGLSPGVDDRRDLDIALPGPPLPHDRPLPLADPRPPDRNADFTLDCGSHRAVVGFLPAFGVPSAGFRRRRRHTFLT